MGKHLLIASIGASFLMPSVVVAAEPASTPPPAAPQTYDQLKTVELERDVIELPAPPGMEARRENFAQRNDPARIEALAKEFFRLWDTGESKASRETITRRLDPVKAAIYKLHEEGKHQEALDAFRAYFFAKLRLIYRDRKGCLEGLRTTLLARKQHQKLRRDARAVDAGGLPGSRDEGNGAHRGTR